MSGTLSRDRSPGRRQLDGLPTAEQVGDMFKLCGSGHSLVEERTISESPVPPLRLGKCATRPAPLQMSSARCQDAPSELMSASPVRRPEFKLERAASSDPEVRRAQSMKADVRHLTRSNFKQIVRRISTRNHQLRSPLRRVQQQSSMCQGMHHLQMLHCLPPPCSPVSQIINIGVISTVTGTCLSFRTCTWAVRRRRRGERAAVEEGAAGRRRLAGAPRGPSPNRPVSDSPPTLDNAPKVRLCLDAALKKRNL